MLTVVPEFIKAIQAWKEAKEKQPETITLPMRAFLLKQWLDLLAKRFEACLASDTSKAQAAEMLVLDSDGMVPYLEWDQQAKEMKVKKDREPMRPEHVLEMLTRMQALALQPLAVMRFHAIHKLGWQMNSEVVPMMLEIGARTPEANRLWEDFGRLTWPLILPAPLHTLATEPSGTVALQPLIDEWSSSQAGLHGLATEPLALLLQVNRFVPCQGDVHKVTVPVVPEIFIYVPRFENSLEDADPLSLQYSRYCRVSSFLHFGDRPSEGHYRAILYDANVGALITDDNVAAARLSPEEASAYHSQGYAFIYRLCPVSD